MTAIIKQSNVPEVEVEADLGYGKLLSTLIRRRNWFLGVLAGALSLSTILALTQEPVYESSFQLLIDDDTIHSPQELEQECGQILLGVIPKLPAESLNQQNSDLLVNQFSDRDRSIEQAIYLRPLREAGVVLIEKINRITKSKLSEANALLSQLNVLGIVADGGEASEAKLGKIYQPQWESMLKELPPAELNSS